MSHHHTRVSERDCSSSSGNIFQRNSHSCTNLAELVIAFSRRRGDQLTQLQRRAWERYYTQLLKFSNFSDAALLEKYFDVFDDVFFFGTLKSHCKVALQSSYQTNVRGACDSTFFSEFKDLLFHSGRNYNIKIYKSREEDRMDRLLYYLGTLLHEMVHAFLMLWGCDRSSCPKNEGHGETFLDIAYALAKAARDSGFFNLKVSLGLTVSLAVELQKTGERVPSDSHLARWGIRRDELRNYL